MVASTGSAQPSSRCVPTTIIAIIRNPTTRSSVVMSFITSMKRAWLAMTWMPP